MNKVLLIAESEEAKLKKSEERIKKLEMKFKECIECQLTNKGYNEK